MIQQLHNAAFEARLLNLPAFWLERTRSRRAPMPNRAMCRLPGSTSANKRDRRGDRGKHKCGLRAQGSTCAPLIGRPRSSQQSVVDCLAQVRLVLLVGVPFDKEFIPHGLHLPRPLINGATRQ
jgi:hypothetical protein